jgi:hypothetical protein
MKQDSSWRKVLDKLLPEFLAFFFRKIYQAIDFKKGFEFLDKELQKILPQEDDTGKRIVDKLVKVFMLDGSEKWLLIHIEIQGYREHDFPARVYHCNYRIHDRFKEKVISVALLTDDDPAFRENVYQISQWGFELYFKFPLVKLLDYRDKWEELERDPNPFAIATMAFLKTVETKGNKQKRYQWKKHFLLELYRKGMSREIIVALNDFIAVLMALPQAKDEKLYDEIKQTAEEKQMSLFAVAERVGFKQGRKQGIEKGIEKGIAQGLKDTISDILEIKFGVAGLRMFNGVKPITDIAVLRKIRAGLKQAPSVAEAERLILRHAKNLRKSA